MGIKILVSDPLSSEGINLFKENKMYDVTVKTGLTEDELIEIIPQFDGLVIRSGTKANQNVLEAAKNLKIIGRAGVGVDNVDIPVASRRGIIVMNTPGGNTISAAEHTMSMMLALARNIPQADKSLREHEWKRKFFTGTEVYNKILGIIGLGKIGMEVAKRAKAFGMNIVVYDPFATSEHAQKIGARLGSFDEIIKSADFITLHLPRNKDTENLINKDSIAKMKDGVRIINVARGGIVNEKDLADAIEKGKVKGAALDVFVTEPCTDSPVFELDRAIVTPHLGASTEEAQINVAIDIVKQIRDFFEKDLIRNAVNAMSFGSKVMKELEPFISLGEKIGTLQAQLVQDKGGINELEIQYAGDISEGEVSPVTISVLKGLLKSIEEDVNSVNASFLAKERGIKIKETKVSKIDDLVNLISVTVKIGKEKSVISGTVFYKNNIRIIRINDYSIDITPSGHILICTNKDIPGVIGRLGSALADAGINIANMQVSRNISLGEALMITTIDQQVSGDILKTIKNIPDITSVKLINL